MPLKYIHSPIKWRAIFAESAFIGASILLAFALQDWDEDKDIEHRTMIALCNVKSELIFNQELLKNDYIPRQQGMLSLSEAAIFELKAESKTKIQLNQFQEILLTEPLRYSAWTLAGESGYLVYANFELATEIGALIDYQEDRYKMIVQRMNSSIIDLKVLVDTSPLKRFITLKDMINEWTIQTEYLESRYDNLFQREDFIALTCNE
ncbi:hypothetical protein [Litorilituus lipolyticus]|uniref:Uncharacterized protein n=1 Tax=Litorilituus lipolyticus TaxID=2491017 RepID=A0A502L5X4_9GAMM|nr:hypothetical protein [Litorilituus lipolyticus]TPH19292.1 hypothetical protein EPA86_00770 [Litorilituus lipolyticus]